MNFNVRPILIGNWKMNGSIKLIEDLEIIEKNIKYSSHSNIDIVICFPFTLLTRASEKFCNSRLMIGGQDCHQERYGPHTGDISATMLYETGARWVILGHSDRRINHYETDEIIFSKIRSACSSGLRIIFCIGETQEERDQGSTLDILYHQCKFLNSKNINPDNLIIAYEPIWAIGTGKTPNLFEISLVHDFLRKILQERFGELGNAIRLIYGGSVNLKNCLDIFRITNVNGALVGKSSLKSLEFLEIYIKYKNYLHITKNIY